MKYTCSDVSFYSKILNFFIFLLLGVEEGAELFFRQTVHHHCRLEAEDNFERMPGEIYCGKKPKAPEEVSFRLCLLLGFNVWSRYRARSDLSSFTGQLVVLDSTE